MDTNTKDGVSRRTFLQAVGGLALTGTLPEPPKAETLVKTLFESLTPKQRETISLPWDHPKRSQVGANWAIVKPTIAETFTADQQKMVEGILRGVTSEEWYPRVLQQMKEDGGGLENYHVALFGDPKSGKFEWVLTGRHVTLRADGHSNANAAFGGPIFYGHAPKDTEDPKHPGNIYWQQAQQANAVFQALDGKQRALALFDKAPNEDQIKLQGKSGTFPGVAIGELSKDQKKLVQKTMQSLLAPYRPSDASDTMKAIEANGGLDKIHLSFYKQEDLGSDGVWDIWRLEGPALVWHFRGAPHVHTWVNVAKDAKLADGHV